MQEQPRRAQFPFWDSQIPLPRPCKLDNTHFTPSSDFYMIPWKGNGKFHPNWPIYMCTCVCNPMAHLDFHTAPVANQRTWRPHQWQHKITCSGKREENEKSITIICFIMLKYFCQTQKGRKKNFSAKLLRAEELENTNEGQQICSASLEH